MRAVVPGMRGAGGLRCALLASLLLHGLALGLLLSLDLGAPARPDAGLHVYTVRILEVDADAAAIPAAGTAATPTTAPPPVQRVAAQPAASPPPQVASRPPPPPATAAEPAPPRPVPAHVAPPPLVPRPGTSAAPTAVAAARPHTPPSAPSDPRRAAALEPAAVSPLAASSPDPTVRGTAAAAPAVARVDGDTQPWAALQPSPPDDGTPRPRRLVSVPALDAGFRLVAPVEPRYPAAARRLRRPGTVRLELEVAPDGRVTTLRLEEQPAGWGFGAAVRAAYAGARFTPPTWGGEPVRVRWRKTLHFRP